MLYVSEFPGSDCPPPKTHRYRPEHRFLDAHPHTDRRRGRMIRWSLPQRLAGQPSVSASHLEGSRHVEIHNIC
jgi:hypothetical protein